MPNSNQNDKLTREIIKLSVVKAILAIDGVKKIKDDKYSYNKDGSLDLDLYLIIEFGKKIPDVAWNVQDCTKHAIEDLTDVKVNSIDIHVSGVEI